MFGSFIVELILGCFFILALLGVVVTALTEAVLAYLALRSKNMQQWLSKFVEELNAGKGGGALELQQLMNGPWLAPLRGPSGAAPSFIPADRFAAALLDLVASPVQDSVLGKDLITFDKELRDRIGALKAPGLAAAFSAMLDSASTEVTTAAQLLEKLKQQTAVWVDQSMDRLQGWTKRRIKLVSLTIAFALCLGLNANIFTVAAMLAKDPQTRAKFAASAYEEDKNNTYLQQNTDCEQKGSDSAKADCYRLEAKKTAEKLASFNELGLGWGQKPAFCNIEFCANKGSWTVAFLYWLFGIVATTFAASLGGEFWFKILGDVIRLTGYKPSKPSAPEKPVKP